MVYLHIMVSPPQAKEANKALPKDDDVVERKEEEEIDKGFVESSSSEDELNEEGAFFCKGQGCIVV
jgi:hypothetical protein